MKYASQVKRTSCVKCAFGTICGTLNFTAPKEQLHYADRHNFTAACRNFTIEIFVNICYSIGESEVHIMPESKLRSQSMDFAVQIINLVKSLIYFV